MSGLPLAKAGIPAAQRVLIVGGGIGGLSAAVALRMIGCRVDLVEINPAWSVYGVGIIQPANVLRALDVLGLADRCVAVGFPFEGTRSYNEDGSQLLDESPFARLTPELPAMNGITRPRLHEILSSATLEAGVTVRTGVTVNTLREAPDGAEITFTDGLQETYDLVLGADGIHSQIRRQIFGEQLVPEYAGQIVWRVNVPRPESVDRITMFMHHGGTAGKAGLTPIGPALAYLFTANTWPQELPLPRTGLAAMMREQLEPYGGLIAELRDRYITADSDIVVRPQESILVPAPWHRGRVLLIGDAAHGPTSKLGQGAAQAIEDGIVLAQELSLHAQLEDVFAAFMERRWARCEFVVSGSLQVGRWEMGLDQDTVDHVGMARRSMEVTAAPI
jgi:2-polyprenyl-6-methoxyphenol hydroxylase-like FAD-dependent oxidoreductase